MSVCQTTKTADFVHVTPTVQHKCDQQHIAVTAAMTAEELLVSL